MREICQYGSEGGGAANRSPYLYFIDDGVPRDYSFCFSAARIWKDRTRAEASGDLALGHQDGAAPRRRKTKRKAGLGCGSL